MADADKEGIHVILDEDDDEQRYVELEEDEFDETQDENYIQQYEGEGNEDTYEVIEDPYKSQYHQNQGEHISNATEYENQENHYLYVNENQYELEINVKQQQSTSKKAIFNLNLGEFTVDEDAQNPEEYQKAESQR